MADVAGAAVEVEGLVVRFGEVVALDWLDLTIAPGTVLGLLGPNGAGKTTLVKVLSTLLRPTAGRAGARSRRGRRAAQRAARVPELDLLFGRQEEVRSLVETLNTPGQHVLLYGERGVGKSSLAKLVAVIVQVSTSRPVFKKRCDSQDSFETLLRGPLAAVGVQPELAEVATTEEAAAKAGYPPFHWSEPPARQCRSWRPTGPTAVSPLLSSEKLCEPLKVCSSSTRPTPLRPLRTDSGWRN